MEIVENNAALRGKFRGALLGTMVGDALGAPVESWNCARINAILDAFPNLPRAEQEMSAAILGMLTGSPVLPGMAWYTDDTQMAIALAQSLAAIGDVYGPDLAACFARNYEPGRGYGMGAHSILSALQRGAQWDEPARKIFGGKGSWGNGAAMRAAPIGVFFHNAPDGVLRRAAEAQAVVTHTHPLGIEGAVVQAASVAVATQWDVSNKSGAFDSVAFIDAVRALTGPLLPEYENALKTVARLIQSPPSDPCAVAHVLGNGIEAHLSVPAALFAFLLHADSFVDAVRFAVRMGGDADTIGAMCGAIAGALHGETALPAYYLDALENGPQGRDFVRNVADELFDAWVDAQETNAS